MNVDIIKPDCNATEYLIKWASAQEGRAIVVSSEDVRTVLDEAKSLTIDELKAGMGGEVREFACLNHESFTEEQKPYLPWGRIRLWSISPEATKDGKGRIFEIPSDERPTLFRFGGW